MFDDLRQSALEPYDSKPEEDKEKTQPEEEAVDEQEQTEAKGIMGLTAPQRFVLSLALLMMTCLLSGVCLVLTEKVVLPFY
jgi:hypothetical protein